MTRLRVLSLFAAATFAAAPLVALAQMPAPATAPTTAATAAPVATTAPATTNPAAVATELREKLSAASEQLRGLLTSPAIFSDPAQRAQVGPKVIPVVKNILSLFDSAVQEKLIPPEAADETKTQFIMLLSLFGDQDATTQLGTMAQSKDVPTSLRAQGAQLMARWLQTGKDGAAQAKVVDELETLDKAHPEDIGLTGLTAYLSMGSATPELSKRLQKIVTDTMKNPAADQFKQRLAMMQQQEEQQKAANDKMAQMENKPLTIKGQTVDGKDFSTDAWKGKVVLVDFWATWCGPCVAELPRVKKLYSTYHDKGLEIIGVSNDFDAKELTDFITKEQTPWPQLFDPKAAGQQDWNPITTGFGIQGIPTMFLIDKKGVLRTVTARENMDEMIPKLLAE